MIKKYNNREHNYNSYVIKLLINGFWSHILPTKIISEYAILKEKSFKYKCNLNYIATFSKAIY
jgi:hypothetical protein